MVTAVQTKQDSQKPGSRKSILNVINYNKQSLWTDERVNLEDLGLIETTEWNNYTQHLESIDFRQVKFLICLKENETKINGKEKLLRLREVETNLLLGLNVFQALWIQHKILREDSVLEYLRTAEEITCIDFFGSIPLISLKLSFLVFNVGAFILT